MRATITSGALRTLLSPVVSIVSKRNCVPVLSCIKLEVESGLLRATSHNFDEIVTSSAPIMGGERGSILAQAHRLARIVSGVPADELVTLSTEDNQLIIDFRDARFSLLTVPIGDFPPEWPDKQVQPGAITFPGGWMQDKLGRAAPFISTEETRYYLNGVCWHAEGRQLALVATDGHKLARILSDVDVSSFVGNGRFILPRAAVSFLIKYFKGETVANFIGEVKLHIQFESGSVIYRAKLIDGTFPDYSRIIPIGGEYAMTVDSSRLLAALRRVSVFDGRNCITLALSGKRLVAHVRDSDEGGATIALPGESNGLPAPISFNSKYLQGICRVGGKSEIKIQFKSAEDPVAITDGADLFILMPMRGQTDKFIELPAGAVAA